MNITKRTLWILMCCLMAVSLAAVSCSPQEEEKTKITEEEGSKVVITETQEAEQKEPVKESNENGLLSPDVPKYGGVFVTTGGSGQNWDYAKAQIMMPLMSMGEELLQGDWAKGPAGTGEVGWTHGFGGFIGLDTGCLAESWELPDDQTVIYHIRPGVHFWNKPPTNGREYTAEDAAWNIERHFTSPSSYLYGMYTRPGYAPTSIKVLDKYTLELKVRPDMQGMVGIAVIGNYLWHISPDVVKAYGDMQDWKNFCGTGPFVLKDFVADSMVILERNPGYWQHDPIHPENQLPYLDGVKLLTIPDTSSQIAALRTGKIDKLENISWDDAEMLMKQCPSIKYKEWLSDFPLELWGRIDKEELPFKDVRVRRALNMAVNKQEIVDEYYSGKAELLCFPFMPLPEFKDIYTPLEEQSEIVRELFQYNPEKARALLAEAGYPQGFKTEIACSSAQADFLSIIREYFLIVGVDMVIKPLETSIYTTTMLSRNFNQMFYSSGKLSLPFRMLEVRKESPWTPSFYENPRTRAAYEAISKVVGKNDAEVARQLKEIGPFILEEAVGVYMPSPYQYIMWWPWVQNFSGEINMGYSKLYSYPTYIWYDEALKESMGY